MAVLKVFLGHLPPLKSSAVCNAYTSETGFPPPLCVCDWKVVSSDAVALSCIGKVRKLAVSPQNNQAK